MSKFYLKTRKMNDFIQNAHRGSMYAERRLEGAIDALNYFDDLSLSDVKTLKSEKERAEAYLETYYELFNSLTNVEKEVFKNIGKRNPLGGLSKEKYLLIRNEIYFKWCKIFEPSEIVYIKDIDMIKFSKEIKEARKSKKFSIKAVAEYLYISDSSIRSYETGRRLPKLNVLYALCELNEIDFKLFCESIIHN